MGRGLAEKGELEPARAQFSEAIRLRPDYTAARLALAQVQLVKREFEPAIKTATDAIAYDRTSIPARLVRASSYMGLNRLDLARSELKGILDENPNSQEAMIQMGVVFAKQKKYKEAEDIFRKSYDLNPANSRGLMGLSEVIMAQSQPERAMKVLQSEIEKYPTRLEFRLALADVEVRSHKFDLAVTEFNGLLDKTDRKSAMAADLYVRLGETQRLAGNFPAAIDALQKARTSCPTMRWF